MTLLLSELDNNVWFFLRFRFVTPSFNAPLVNIVGRLEDRSWTVIVFDKVNFPVMKSCKSLITGGAGIRFEPSMDILMNTLLNICLEGLGAEVTEVFLDLVSSPDVVSQLQLELPAVRAHLGPLRRSRLVHPPHVSLEVMGAGKRLLTDFTIDIGGVQILVHPEHVVLEFGEIICPELTAVSSLWTGEGLAIVNSQSVLPKSGQSHKLNILPLTRKIVTIVYIICGFLPMSFWWWLLNDFLLR